MPEPAAFFARPGPLSDPGAHAELLDGLPREIGALCGVVQGLVVHRDWAPAYGVTLSEERRNEPNARAVEAILARIHELDPRPLAAARMPAARFVGTCRDFSVLLVAMLRAQGIPARARCGFGTYFAPGSFEDHWVAERWDARARRWIQTDAQLDAFQRTALALDFDPLDVPADRFLVAGTAWQMCRLGRADPKQFGIFDLRGLWFVGGNVVRDLAALNRMELLPWDVWGAMAGRDGELGAEQLALLDRVAALSQDPDAAFDEVRRSYRCESGLRVPPTVMNVLSGKAEAIPPGDA